LSESSAAEKQIVFQLASSVMLSHLLHQGGWLPHSDEEQYISKDSKQDPKADKLRKCWKRIVFLVVQSIYSRILPLFTNQ
jgi:hypothetical protein